MSLAERFLWNSGARVKVFLGPEITKPRKPIDPMPIIGLCPGMRVSDQVFNRLNVLKAIRQHGPVSRSDLTALTGLSGATVTQITANLQKRKLIVETRDQRPTATGRPRINIEINADAALVVGVSISGTGRLFASFVDLAGDELFDCEVALAGVRSPGDFAVTIADALVEAIAASPFARDRIDRVGIAVPAIVDNIRGAIYPFTPAATEAIDLAANLSRQLGLNVTIENDMVCMARGEHWFGRASGINTFSLFQLGLVVGSVDYVNGLPRFGRHGFNAEFSHVKMGGTDEGARCFCGARGCLGAISSTWAMARATGILEDDSIESITRTNDVFEQVLDLLDQGSEVARIAFDTAAVHFGMAVSNHINVTDPGDVIILVSTDRLRRALGDTILEAISANTLKTILSRTTIAIETVNDKWRVKGAAALALERIFIEDRVA